MQPEKIRLDRYLPINAVADRLGCSDDAVYDLLARRKLRGFKLGVVRGIRVSEKSLNEFIAAAQSEFEANF